MVLQLVGQAGELRHGQAVATAMAADQHPEGTINGRQGRSGSSRGHELKHLD
jgi:hypothetical protein